MRSGYRGRLVPMLVLAAMLIVGLAYAGSDDIPRISIDDLKRMLDNKADVLILDAQTKSVYDRGHIKGAVSFPWAPDLTPNDVKHLAKEKLIVTYCDCGPGEADSADLATQLVGLGFSNVKVLADPSIRGWMKAGYAVER